jgi:hypothetical protein
MGIVDRQEWAQKRIAFLTEQLQLDPSDEQRAAIERELESLRRDRPWWRRWLWPVRLPHEH